MPWRRWTGGVWGATSGCRSFVDSTHNPKTRDLESNPLPPPSRTAGGGGWRAWIASEGHDDEQAGDELGGELNDGGAPSEMPG
eukprot:2900272-Pyramimonas_sp.AAC.1